MNLFCFGILLAFSLCLLQAPSEAYITRSPGCHHNGTWYADKSLVPTIEKCLNCQCSKKTLVCRLKVCPEMPMPPPRGCVIVQKKNSCCPYLSCARLEAFYKIPITRRIIAYLDHYERESIDRVVNENMLQRRSDDSEVDLFVCVKNGTVYKSGSAMSSSNLCTYCYCIGGSEKCVKPKCMLPVDGCKPIFVDSTCCPVRYDCSTKTSGKSSQEVRYRKTANKHFQRMSQRPQRNRGCTVNKQFYAEGQKMKSDTDKPCDICFCIRGSRRCAPKKCSPALKNCLPVVPKGQCCPSSYDCGIQREHGRSHNSRQFNLYSLLFGKDDEKIGPPTPIPEHYPHDRDPALATAATRYKTREEAMEASSEKSILDTIREGLEFIDGSTKQMLEDNKDLLTLQAKRESIASNNKATLASSSSTLMPDLPTTSPRPTATMTPVIASAVKTLSSTTEISFLDLILGEAENLPKEDNLPIETTPATALSAENQDELSWVDILLGPPDLKLNTTRSESVSEATTNGLSPELITSIDRLDDDIDDDMGTSGEILLNSSEGVKTLNMLRTGNTTTSKPLTTTIKAQSIETSSTTLATDQAIALKPTTRTTVKPLSTEQQPAIKPIPLHSKEAADEKLKKPLKPISPKPAATTKPIRKTDLLTALLGGISDILSAEHLTNNTISTTGNTLIASTTIVAPTKPIKPLPSFKPLPTQKQHTRINSKIANLTVSPPTFALKTAQNTTSTVTLASTTHKPRPTTASTTTTTTSTTTTKKPRPSTTVVTTSLKPLIIKTNPSILESDPLDDSTEPTLPPSLPNLKIIPFLPTDAVEAASSKIFDYTSKGSNTNYELYDDAKLYPAITEHSYAAYAVDMEDDNQAKYIYKFKVEGPSEEAAAPKTPIDDSFLKYEFLEKNGFSPPTKTEGGFVPKEPIPIDDEIIVNGEFNISKLNEIYPATMHIIDITTAEPLRENLTKIIEITTPDPFKDVIHTESPPDLGATIQDKLDIEHLSINSTYQQLKNKSTEHYPIPSTAHLQPTEEKNSIETFLDILFKDEENDSSTKTQFKSSTIPPFKSLPQTTMARLSATKPTITTKIKQTTATTIKTTLSTPITTTTKKIQHLNSTIKFKTKTNATKRLPTQQATSTKSSKPPFSNNIRKSTSKSTSTTTLAPTSTSTVAIPFSSTTTTTTIPTSKLTTTLPTYLAKSNESALLQPTTTTHNPFLMSPFDKLPFMDASFEIKRYQATASPSSSSQSQSPRPLVRLDGLDAAYEISNTIISSTTLTPMTTTTTATSTTTTLHPPLVSAAVTDKYSMSASNSLIDPTGILKLAGCNIYGRMYRVGRIILELSSPCVECKCTETGVKCGQLDC